MIFKICQYNSIHVYTYIYNIYIYTVYIIFFIYTCVCVSYVCFSTVCISPNNDSLVPSSRGTCKVNTRVQVVGHVNVHLPDVLVNWTQQHKYQQVPKIEHRESMPFISEIIYEPYLIRPYMIYIDLFPAALVGHLVIFPQSIFSKSLAPPALRCCRVQWNCWHS